MSKTWNWSRIDYMNWTTVTITVFGKTLTGAQALTILGGVCFFGFVFFIAAVGVAAVSMRRRE